MVDTFLSKGRIGCAVGKSGRRCLMVLTILGVLSRIQVWYCMHFHFYFYYLFVKVFNVVCFFSSSTSVCPCTTNEQEAFIRQVLEIPFDERKCRDLITLDMLHTYCGGPELTPIARRLNTYSRQHKFLFLCFFLPVVFICTCSFFPLSLFASAYLTFVSYPLQKWRQQGKKPW